MKINKIQMDKLRVHSILNDRWVILNTLEDNFDALLNLLEDPIGNNTKAFEPYIFTPESNWSFDPFGNMARPSEEDRLREAIEKLRTLGEDAMAAEKYEKVPQLQEDFEKLITIYEKRYGKYIKRESGNAGPTDGKDGPDRL